MKGSKDSPSSSKGTAVFPCSGCFSLFSSAFSEQSANNQNGATVTLLTLTETNTFYNCYHLRFFSLQLKMSFLFLHSAHCRSFSHLLLFVSDVVNELICLLKDLWFVFSRQVIKSRISQRLENRTKNKSVYS